MRVIAGSAKGHRLKAPRAGAVRPTSDLVRGAIFSMLGSLGADLSRALDLFAGSGALGIEALSRGGAWADFVERDPRACAVIEENLRHAKLSHRARVQCGSAQAALGRLKESYTVIFVDPPYADATLPQFLEALGASPLVAEGTTVVVEHWRRQEVPARMGPLALEVERRHGETVVSIYD